MSTKKSYKQRMDAELDDVQKKLTTFKAQGMDFTPETRKRHAKHIQEIQRKIDLTKVKLIELAEADEHVWEQLKDGVEDIWTTLQSTLEDTIETFKEEKA